MQEPPAGTAFFLFGVSSLKRSLEPPCVADPHLCPAPYVPQRTLPDPYWTLPPLLLSLPPLLTWKIPLGQAAMRFTEFPFFFFSFFFIFYLGARVVQSYLGFTCRSPSLLTASPWFTQSLFYGFQRPSPDPRHGIYEYTVSCCALLPLAIVCVSC